MYVGWDFQKTKQDHAKKGKNFQKSPEIFFKKWGNTAVLGNPPMGVQRPNAPRPAAQRTPGGGGIAALYEITKKKTCMFYWRWHNHMLENIVHNGWPSQPPSPVPPSRMQSLISVGQAFEDLLEFIAEPLWPRCFRLVAFRCLSSLHFFVSLMHKICPNNVVVMHVQRAREGSSGGTPLFPVGKLCSH